MVRTLAEQDVEFDIMLQLQTDPFRMPIENAAVRWPEKLSPFVPAARLHIPRQKFDFAGAARLRQQPVVQPVALHRPNIARSATRAARGAGCTGSCRSSASR